MDVQVVITWIPSDCQSSPTNALVILATDNGVPALSATGTFAVVVTQLISLPFGSVAKAIPGRVEAEDYDLGRI